MNEQSATLFRAKKNYIHRKVANRDVLISVGENVANFNGYIELNSTASFIWETLNKACTADALAKALIKEFSVGQDQAKADVAEFLELLKEHDMVEAV